MYMYVGAESEGGSLVPRPFEGEEEENGPGTYGQRMR
jgi:hypothetical protein